MNKTRTQLAVSMIINVILLIAACGGHKDKPSPVPPRGNEAHVAKSPRASNSIFPTTSATTVLAEVETDAVHAAGPSLAQSFNLPCTFADPSLSAVPAGNLLELEGPEACTGSVSAPRADLGSQMIFDGTLSSLVATGVAEDGSQFRCTDVLTNVPTLDHDLVTAYLDPTNHRVVLTKSGAITQFACTGLPSEIKQITVQWAKI